MSFHANLWFGLCTSVNIDLYIIFYELIFPLDRVFIAIFLTRTIKNNIEKQLFRLRQYQQTNKQIYLASNPNPILVREHCIPPSIVLYVGFYILTFLLCYVCFLVCLQICFRDGNSQCNMLYVQGLCCIWFVLGLMLNLSFSTLASINPQNTHWEMIFLC
jgi:hypothetical protein